MSVTEIPNIGTALPGTGARARSPETVPGAPFAEVLRESIGTVDRLQRNANRAIEDLTTGKRTDIHRTMIEMEKAGTAFELLMQVRNKMITAYEEIMRMQI